MGDATNRRASTRRRSRLIKPADSLSSSVWLIRGRRNRRRPCCVELLVTTLPRNPQIGVTVQLGGCIYLNRASECAWPGM